MRMQSHGVELVSLFSVYADLQRDFRNTPPSPYIAYPWTDQYLTAGGFVTRAFAAAVLNGTLGPGEAQLVKGTVG